MKSEEIETKTVSRGTQQAITDNEMRLIYIAVFLILVMAICVGIYYANESTKRRDRNSERYVSISSG